MRAATKLVAAAGLVLPALLVSAPAHATLTAGNGQEVCAGRDSGKIDVSGDHASVTVTAPDGKLISGYCVKAGSDRSGAGLENVVVDPPAKSVTITHSSGKDVSHYSVSYVAGPTPTTPPPTGTPTTPPPTTAPTTAPTDGTPTTAPPTTAPTDGTPTTAPTAPTDGTAPTSPTTTTPSQAVASATQTAPGDESDDGSDQGVAGDDESATPTAVDAGLTAGTTPGSTTWLATVAGFAGVALLAASAYLMRMRKRGDHRA